MIFQKQIERIYKSKLFARCDDSGVVRYFSHADFPSLSALPYAFCSSQGHRLQGYFYSYQSYDPDRLILFEHGMGGGHRSYMKEIERLCAKGYRVFAYDHTGCMESQGEGTGGFAQSLRDLDDCIKALKTDSDVNTSDLSVVGHSWGGYSTLNITAFHPDIKRLVVLSGAVSVQRLIDQNFQGLLKPYRKHVLRLEADANPQYVGCDATETLQETRAKALLIYSENDLMIQKKFHYDPLCKALQGKENIRLMLVPNKGHNVNYTEDAVQYLGRLSAELKKKAPKTAEEKETFRNSFDWNRMTAQDDKIWKLILQALQD